MLVSSMESEILPPAPEGSELARWESDGVRHKQSDSEVVTIISPDNRYALSVAVDDHVSGYFVELDAYDHDAEQSLGRTIVDDRELAIQVATNMAANAEDLEDLADLSLAGPDVVQHPTGDQAETETPDDWNSDEWNDALEEAFEKADISRSKGTLTTKTIDDRDYYYLQWREGDTVTSQYVAPVVPSKRGSSD